MFHVSRYQLKHVSPDITSSIVTPTFNVQSRLIRIAVVLQGRYLIISDDNAKWKVWESGQPMQFMCCISVKKQKTKQQQKQRLRSALCLILHSMMNLKHPDKSPKLKRPH